MSARSVCLNDDLWLKIWCEVEPTPPQMGELRGISQQMCRVLNADALWLHHAPQEGPGDVPLRDAFMARVGRRSLRGNQLLAEAYKPENSVMGYEYVKHYLLIGPYGRDDDYDAAMCQRGWVEWKDFSQVLRNHPAIGTRGIQRNGFVLNYLGAKLHTPERIEMALASQGKVLAMLSARDRDQLGFAQIACTQDEDAFSWASLRLQADATFCTWYLDRYPNKTEFIAVSLRNDESFFGDALVQRLKSAHCLWKALGPDLRKNKSYLSDLFADGEPEPKSRVVNSDDPYDDAHLAQRMWRQAFRDHSFISHLSDRLKSRFAHIDGPRFLADSSVPTVEMNVEGPSLIAPHSDSIVDFYPSQPSATLPLQSWDVSGLQDVNSLFLVHGAPTQNRRSSVNAEAHVLPQPMFDLEAQLPLRPVVFASVRRFCRNAWRMIVSSTRS